MIGEVIRHPRKRWLCLGIWLILGDWRKERNMNQNTLRQPGYSDGQYFLIFQVILLFYLCYY